MPQHLRVYQSLWAMERRRPDKLEWTLGEKLTMIRDAGYDGCGFGFTDPHYAREVTSWLRDHGMTWQAQCYPKSIDDLRPVLDLVAELGADHVNLQPDVRPMRLHDCIRYLEGWRRIARDASVPVYIETHRDRMTTDLFFTHELLDCFPDLQLTADVSHFVVGREFAFPIPPEAHAQIHRILDHTWAIHGRVASREQVQIQLSFPHMKHWVDLFMGWWEYAIRSWRKRADDDAVLTFLCELGPPEYAITGADGYELSDRWAEALWMKDAIRALWAKIEAEG
jgi:hypothetical protein